MRLASLLCTNTYSALSPQQGHLWQMTFAEHATPKARAAEQVLNMVTCFDLTTCSSTASAAPPQQGHLCHEKMLSMQTQRPSCTAGIRPHTEACVLYIQPHAQHPPPSKGSAAITPARATDLSLLRTDPLGQTSRAGTEDGEHAFQA